MVLLCNVCGLCFVMFVCLVACHSVVCCPVLMLLCPAGANVLAADEEGETCLHLAFARHTSAINLDQAEAVQRVMYNNFSSQFYSAVSWFCPAKQ